MSTCACIEGVRGSNLAIHEATAEVVPGLVAVAWCCDRQAYFIDTPAKLRLGVSDVIELTWLLQVTPVESSRQLSIQLVLLAAVQRLLAWQVLLIHRVHVFQ